MTKNEIVARWLGWTKGEPNSDVSDLWFKDGKHRKYWNYEDYNLLHEAWRKFRDLQYTDGDGGMHEHIKSCIITKIVYGTITEAFDELVKGIEWYNSLNEKV